MSLARITRRDVMVGAGAAVLATALPVPLAASVLRPPPPTREEAFSTGLLPHAPNGNGWPYRINISIGGYIRSAFHASHQLSIQFLGSDHVQLIRRNLFNPTCVCRCWLPGPWQKANMAVALEEIDFVEGFVARLPEDATLHIFSLSVGFQAAAMALGLLASRTDAETAIHVMQLNRQLGNHQPMLTDQFIIEAWDRHLKLKGKLVDAVERSSYIDLVERRRTSEHV